MKDPVFKGLIQLCSGTSRYRGRTRPNYSDCRETSKIVNAPVSKKRKSVNDTNPVSPVRVRRMGHNYFEPSLDESPLSEMRRRAEAVMEGITNDWQYSYYQSTIEEYIADKGDIGAVKITRPPVPEERIIDFNNQGFMEDLLSSIIFAGNEQIAGQSVVLFYPDGEFLPLQIAHDKITSRRDQSPYNIRMNQYGVNYTIIRSDGRCLNEFEVNQAEHLAWTVDGRAVFVWMEHTAFVAKKLLEAQLQNMGVPYTFELPMVAVKLEES
jgi:hypothetical protein